MHTSNRTVKTKKVDANGHRVEGGIIRVGNDYIHGHGVSFADEDNWVARANRRPRIVTRNGKVVSHET